MKNIKNDVFAKVDFVSMGAGARAVKGAGIIIPNLLCFEDSMAVIDPKREDQKNR